MGVKFVSNDTELVVKLMGEIDHHSAAFLREYIDNKITNISTGKIVISFDEVTFMDSSAIGLLMGRYKTAKSCGCRMAVIGLSERNKMLMRMAGLDKIIEFEG